MRRAPRCHAKSKRSGLQCRAPAVRGTKRAACTEPPAGAPKGNRNALKHGEFTAESLGFKKEIAVLARMARKIMSAIESRDAKSARVVAAH
jgi:uncharacterized protein YjcR